MNGHDRDSLSRLNDLIVSDDPNIGRWLETSQDVHRSVVGPVALAISSIVQVVVQWESDLLTGKNSTLNDTPQFPDVLADTIDAAVAGACASSQSGDLLTALVGAIAGAARTFSTLPIDVLPSLNQETNEI